MIIVDEDDADIGFELNEHVMPSDAEPESFIYLQMDQKNLKLKKERKRMSC